MLLPPRDAETFFKLNGMWIFYLNEHLGLYPTFAETGVLPKFSAAQRAKIRDAGLKHPQLLRTLLDDDPFGFSDAEKKILGNYRYGVCDTFYLTEHRPEYSVFVSSRNPDQVYGVIGLTEELPQLVKLPPPVELKTMLYPWKEWWVNDVLKVSKNPLPAELAAPLAELSAAAITGGWLRRHPREAFVAPPELAEVVSAVRDWRPPKKRR
jgi:hypothetical protein